MPLVSDGTVLSSANCTHPAVDEDMRMSHPMIGLILNVYPSDNENNLTATSKADDRGWRHECQVLVVDNNSDPYLLLDNVIIPPGSHSGIDNFDEDLPRGLGKNLVTGEAIPDEFEKIDVNSLDAEWCVVGFIGGSLDKPFIQNWWYHPRNNYDPATANEATGSTTLDQVDVSKNRFRKLRRINGSWLAVNTKGDIYLNTVSANSGVKLENGAPDKTQFSTGGSIQVDIKPSQQLEFNWNLYVDGLAAGSNSSTQSRDPSLPQIKHTESKPSVRETSRSILRLKEYSALLKTSRVNVQCQKEEEDGEFTVLAEDKISLMQGDSTVALIALQDGIIQAIAEDGSIISIGNDSVSLANKSGSVLSLLAGGNVALSGSAIGISAPCSIGGATGQPLVKGTVFNASFSEYLSAEVTLATTNSSAYASLAAACSGPPLSPLATYFSNLATAWSNYGASVSLIKGLLNTFLTTGVTAA